MIHRRRSMLVACGSLLCAVSLAGAAVEVRALPEPYPYPEAAWSPYVVGALIGVLTLVSLVLARMPVGASSGYADAAGLIGRVIVPKHIFSLPYYREHVPKISWTLVFVLGAIGGSYLAALSGGEITGTYLQDMWVARFGPESYALRTGCALVGGMVMAYGARLAGGCTSGHGISGTLQLAVSSWIAVVCFFIGGIVCAMLMYRL